MSETDIDLGFAPEDDAPILYMTRTREWYLALGYGNPYRWAHYAEVPFTALKKPLSETTVALLSTAAPYDPSKGDQGVGAPLNAKAKFYKVYAGESALDHDVRVSHVSIDRKHTTMEDRNTWFPLPALRAAVAAGRLGRLSRHFLGIPTNRSQRHTLEIDCPEILRRCLEDGVEAVVLVPNCPVCHQTLSLVARYLEAAGLSTVMMICAKDIVEHCGVPRAMFSDFPLGNAAGKPKDPASQAATLELALRTLESAPAARTTVQSPQRWRASHEWKRDYSNLSTLSPQELARLRSENDRAKEAAKALRDDQLA